MVGGSVFYQVYCYGYMDMVRCVCSVPGSNKLGIVKILSLWLRLQVQLARVLATQGRDPPLDPSVTLEHP